MSFEVDEVLEEMDARNELVLARRELDRVRRRAARTEQRARELLAAFGRLWAHVEALRSEVEGRGDDTSEP